ncbi:MAG TPA: phosphatase PAP2 family protein [Pyrinomonadaceae bacterium]
MRVIAVTALFIVSLFLTGASTGYSQTDQPETPSATGSKAFATPTPTPSPSPSPSPVFKRPASLESHFVQHVFHDQVAIWTAPFHPGNYEKKLVFPAVIGVAAVFATDRYTSDWVQTSGTLPAASRFVSHFGQAYSTGGIAAAFYVAGRLTHNAKARETGVLAAQSLIDTGIVTEVLKVAAQRQRPNTDEHFGEFFDGGSSFPSGHSSSIWSVATVVAYEYHNNPWIKYGAYAAAVAVSMSRYSGRNHFLSDIVGGSAVGFFIGRYVYRNYHDPDIDQPTPKKTTWLRPTFLPYYDGRMHSYGGSLVWQL